MSDHDMVQALERAGIEVEQIIASPPLDKHVIVAEVKKVVQHPGADRLKIASVWTGEREYGVVCGAPNVRAGLKVAFAQIGATLPSGDRIEKAKLRGEVSEGMLCSERELGLGQDHNGIIELEADLGVGTPLCDVYPADAVIDIKTPANRFDVMSVVGLAREVSAMTDVPLKPLTSPPVLASGPGPEVESGAAAARYMLARVKLGTLSPSPRPMAAKLRAAGMRPISPVVDLTNYVMLELGQPLHAFDADKVKLPVQVRAARSGETLKTLDGIERRLSKEDLVIADQNGPIAIAGVMGGAGTEVGPDTREILLEAAVFDGAAVRKTAKRHGLRTEASARFERRLPVQLSPLALGRFLELLPGAQLDGVTDQLNVWPWVQRIGLPVSRLTSLLGFEVSPKEALAALKKLEIEAVAFDIAKQARTLVGKPYKLGASYKTDGLEAFDSSYLTDYLYSLIGIQIGFTALGQFELGRPVDDAELMPGDLVFVKGDNASVVQDHYYTRGDDGDYVKHAVKPAKRVGAVGLFVGNDKVVFASAQQQQVVEVGLAEFTKAEGYLGARRFVEGIGDYIAVPSVPWWRSDLKLPEDLVEEVVRVIGYERVPSSIPSWRPTRLEFDRTRARRRRIRDVMYGAGLFEVMTYSFVSLDQLESLGLDPGDHLKLKNPLSSEQAYLRSSLLPSHLAVVAKNRHYDSQFGFYEVSHIFEKRALGDQPDEPLRLAITLVRPESALAHLKGILDALARELNLELNVTPGRSEGFAPGRYGEVRLGSKRLGGFGQVHPEKARALKLDGELVYAELDLTPLVMEASARQFQGVPRFPVIQRDVTLLLPVPTTWRQVVEALEPQPVDFVSYYHGRELPDGFKGLTLRLTLSNPDRTPTEPEAADLEASIVRRLERKLGAQRRD
jgi:phenylalanyl-tRNA synthetase beta subunit